jgi:hypothetical protein
LVPWERQAVAKEGRFSEQVEPDQPSEQEQEPSTVRQEPWPVERRERGERDNHRRKKRKGRESQ